MTDTDDITRSPGSPLLYYPHGDRSRAPFGPFQGDAFSHEADQQQHPPVLTHLFPHGDHTQQPQSLYHYFDEPQIPGSVVAQRTLHGDGYQHISTSYDYSNADESVGESPLSENLSLASIVHSNGPSSFYNQSNESHIERNIDMYTQPTFGDRPSHTWGQEPRPWDTLMTPTEFDYPPFRVQAKETAFPLSDQVLSHFSMGITPNQQPQLPTPQESYQPPQTPTQHQHENSRPYTEKELIKKEEDYFLEEHIPRENVQRLERYLQRVRDVHLDEDSGGEKSLLTPLDEDKRLDKDDAKDKVKKVVKTLPKVLPNPDPYDESEYVPIVGLLRDNPVLWEKVQATKKKGIYKCTHCPNVFSSLLDLAKHLDEFKVVRPHRCPFPECPWSALGLPRRAEMRRHCAAQHACIIQFEGDHIETGSNNPGSPDGAHFQEAEKFQCPYQLCNKVFKRKDARQRHEKLVHLNPHSRFNRRVDNLREKYGTKVVSELALLMKNSSTPTPQMGL